MKKIFWVLILFTLFPQFISAQNYSEDEKQILILQDSRTLGENNKLLNYLKSPEKTTVITALNALANIGDSNTVDNLGDALLNGKEIQIRTAAAFALGQIPCNNSVDYLTKALNSEKEAEPLVPILNSLGKIGSENELQIVLNYKNNEEKRVITAKILSIGRFAIRKIRNSESVEFLKSVANLYSSDDTSVLKPATYALWRTADKDLLFPARGEILNLTKSLDPDIRMWAFSALGKILVIDDVDYMIENLKTEGDWKVKINILNSLPGYKSVSERFLDDNLLKVFDILSVDYNPNVRITALKTIGILFSNLKEKNKNLDDVGKTLEAYFLTEKEIDWQEIGEAIKSYGMIFKDKAREVLLRAFSQIDDYDVKPCILKAFGYFDDPMIYKEVRDSIISDVKKYAGKLNIDTHVMIGSPDLLKMYRAFVEMVTMLDKKMDEENLNIARLIYSEFTSSKDPLLVSMCLNALKDSLYLQYREETSAIITFDYSELVLPNDYDVMLLFIDAFGEMQVNTAAEILEKNLKSDNYEIASYSTRVLEKITGKQYTFTAKPRYDFDWNTLQRIYQNKFATIYTDVGDIKIELLPEIAPFTVLNFVKLANRDYYYGKSFFRIVPNFVIQGGDWSNSGEGSPGYTIRSEFSSFSFERGVIGMASSGKDTEGSQIFIMHSPHYHLDGRYTAFGIVKDGFDVLDNIVYGNTIIRIDFSSN